MRDRDWAPNCVAVMAHWSADPEPSRSVVVLLQELAAGGYDTVLVSAADGVGPLGRACTWALGEPVMPRATTVLRRANVGYDFGSWSAVLAAFPGIRAARRVLLVNDSLIGPFSALGPVLAAFEAATAPVWGLSGSLQHRPHLQSFFVGYKDGVLDHPALRSFWTDIRVESRKARIVRYDELGLSEALDEAGIGWRALYEPQPSGPPNPTINDWQRLLGEGFPFIKAEIVHKPPHWLQDWQEIRPAVLEVWHEDLDQWLPPQRALEGPAAPGLRQRVVGQGMSVFDVEGPAGLVRAGAGSLRRRLSRRR